MGPTQGTKQREREQEEEHLLFHLESSWLEMRSRDRFLLIRKNKEPRERSQADRREVRIIHHQEGLYQTSPLSVSGVGGPEVLVRAARWIKRAF